ncbi:MAG TPA: transglycosylase domain-containing protein [Candidatus Limnocylindrales bacterium]|nr:transglycosylase domain-containing protein [Candidatus Limnocylindrales bacterium]
MLAERAAARNKPRRAPFGKVFLGIMLAIVVVGAATGGIAVAVGVGVIRAMSNGLPDPAALDSLTFNQPTIIYDRTGTVELARFQQQNRRVVSYEQVPTLVLDATTTAEDRSFWTNDGYDPAAIVAAAVQNAQGDSGERGASTITQQLVRARLLPQEVLNGSDKYLRKVLEIIQASRLTSAFPGEAGKEKIITSYLNEIYYGHEAYGIAAAARVYFGVDDLSKLTPAQAALLAGLPKSPSTYDPYRYAVKNGDGEYVVPDDAAAVVRRNYILSNWQATKGSPLTAAQITKALAEPVILKGPQPIIMKAPHFSWAVRDQLAQMLGGISAVETGGYKVITTLDWTGQQLGERYMYGAAVIPNLSKSDAAKALDAMDFSKSDRRWITALRGTDVHNGALVAVDYRTGDVLTYVGSAAYYRDDLASSKFAPQHDAASAWRQPGSAFKAVLYASAFETHKLTPGSLLLDISTNFGGGWSPKDADSLERGPVLVRGAVQQSLNLPAIRALQRVGNEPVADIAAQLGLQFEGGKTAFLQAGLAGAIGTVETRPIDLVSAYGSLANGGVHVPTRMILSITGPDGKNVFTAPDPSSVASKAISPEAAFLISDVLAGNTDPTQNRFWSQTLAIKNGPDGKRRPAAAKTGTADSRRDFSTYGYLAPPEDPSEPGIAVGVWMGNSDHSAPSTPKHGTSLTTAGQVWHAFLRDYSKDMPVASFQPPKGVVEAKIDRWSGGKPGPWTRQTITEWFIKGTEPGAKKEIDQAGLLYSRSCGSWAVDPAQAEFGPSSWKKDVEAWVSRARHGTGTKGPYGSTIAYWFGQRTWGGPLIGPCQPKPTPNPSGGPGGGGGNGGGGGHGKPTQPPATLPPPPNQQAPASPEPTQAPTDGTLAVLLGLPLLPVVPLALLPKRRSKATHLR